MVMVRGQEATAIAAPSVGSFLTTTTINALLASVHRQSFKKTSTLKLKVTFFF
jgi:hypothetical protein